MALWLAFGPLLGVLVGYAIGGGFRRVERPMYLSRVGTQAPTNTELRA